MRKSISVVLVLLVASAAASCRREEPAPLKLSQIDGNQSITR